VSIFAQRVGLTSVVLVDLVHCRGHSWPIVSAQLLVERCFDPVFSAVVLCLLPIPPGKEHHELAGVLVS
jgi:hypothetical protein